MKRYDFIVEFSFHIGELYFIIPFLHHLYRRRPFRWWSARINEPRVCLLFTKPEVWEAFQADVLLQKAVARIDCDILRSFDVRDGQSTPAAGQFCKDVLKRAPMLLSHIGGSLAKRIAHTHYGDELRVVLFPHTSSPALFNLDVASRMGLKQRGDAKSAVLTPDPESAGYYQLTGIPRSIVIGYHSIAAPWRKIITQVSKQEQPQLARAKPFALVFSYGARDDVLTVEQWTELHLTTYVAIRKEFPDIKIVFKPHPSQDLDALRTLVSAQGMYGAEISLENPLLLAERAAFAVSYLTGGIFNALYVGTPAINYFNGRSTYERARGGFKHNYAALGIADVESEQDLAEWLRTVRIGKTHTHFLNEKSAIPLIETPEAFQKALS